MEVIQLSNENNLKLKIMMNINLIFIKMFS